MKYSELFQRFLRQGYGAEEAKAQAIQALIRAKARSGRERAVREAMESVGMVDAVSEKSEQEANPLLAIFGYTGKEKWESFNCKLCGKPDFGKGMEGICASCWSKK